MGEPGIRAAIRRWYYIHFMRYCDDPACARSRTTEKYIYTHYHRTGWH